MTNLIDEHSPIESIFGAVANWVTRYRQAVGLKRELDQRFRSSKSYQAALSSL